MAIGWSTNVTSFEDPFYNDTTSGAIAFTVNVGDCVVVVVASNTGFTFLRTVTDDGGSGGNTYIQQAYYNNISNGPNIAIYTTIATVTAANITCNWTAVTTLHSVAITSYRGVGSIGPNNGTNFVLAVNTETITCTLANPNNWAVAGLSHRWNGPASNPAQQNGNLRVTSAGTGTNDYTSISDNTGSTSVVCSNTYGGTSNQFAAVYCELVPSGGGSVTIPEMPDMTPGTCVMWRKT